MSPLLSWQSTFSSTGFCVCVFVQHAMFSCLCVCFPLGPANFWRNPSSNFLLNETRHSIKIKSHYLCCTTCDNPGGTAYVSRRARRIPSLSYRTAARFLINVIQCHTRGGNSRSDRMNPQGLDNRVHYHPLFRTTSVPDRGILCYNIFAETLMRPFPFLSSQPDEYLSFIYTNS